MAKVNVNCIFLDEGGAYVSSDKKLWPCCYHHYQDENLGSVNGMQKLYDKYGKDFNDLTVYNIDEVSNHEWFTTVLRESLDTEHPLYFRTCYNSCGIDMADKIEEVIEKEYWNNDKTESATIALQNNTTVGIFLSGGVDSGLLLYLMVKQIMESSLNVKIQPITWRRPYGKPLPQDWNVPYAQDVIDAVNLLLDPYDIIKERYIFDPEWSDRPLSSEKERSEWLRAHQIAKTELGVDKMVYGTTSNPDESQMKMHDLMDGREEHRDKKYRERHLHNKANPFMTVDKRFLYEIYEQEGLLDTLFPITRSCEAYSDATNDYTTPCEHCWWCKERKWAFGVF